jgi:hypothetical protein
MKFRAGLVLATVLATTLNGLLVHGIAQSVADSTSAGSTAPSTTVPSDANYRAHPLWNNECEARAKADIGRRVDIIFVGDSITQNWTGPDWGGERRGRRVWAQYYANRHSLNFGVGADETQNVLWRMDIMPIQGLRPKVAVVMIGVR